MEERGTNIVKQDEKQIGWILGLCGIIPVVWLALLIAPHISGGLMEIIEKFPIAINQPFHIDFCKDSIKTVLIFLGAYALGIGIYLSTRRNYRKGEEHGSAKWGDAKVVNRKYSEKDFCANKILTMNVYISYNGRKHRRNLLYLLLLSQTFHLPNLNS